MSCGLPSQEISIRKRYKLLEKEYQELKTNYDNLLNSLSKLSECYEAVYIRELKCRDEKIAELKTQINKLERRIYGLEQTVKNKIAKEKIYYMNL